MKLAPFSVLAMLALAACQQPDEKAAEARPASALSEGRLVLPAVRGNPGAAYFTYRNGSAATATMLAVSVNGAQRAEMHETTGSSMAALSQVAIAPGAAVRFEPGGKHVMVFGVPASAKAGDSIQVTITFADGVMRSAPLAVEAAGGMAGMEHTR